MAAGYCYFLGINSNAFFLKDNKKPFILGLNVPKVTAYQGNPSAGISPAPTEDAVVIKYVNLGLSNGMKIEHHNLSYSGLQSFISKLQALCLA